MRTQAIEKFSIWARAELMRGVDQRAYDLALKPDAGNQLPADAAAVSGRVLSNLERTQRTELAGRIDRKGYGRFVEEAAYTWFNRLVAIRYMELHDYLPCRMRVLSGSDGSFEPQVLKESLTVQIEGLDRSRVLELVDAADDEALFHEILIAQCNELARYIPDVFGRVDDADALVLPGNLLRHDSVVAHLVDDLPEELWRDVEILGWMYQFYNKELKDDFFASKRKAAPEDLAPATQLFTPEWIVRYMVDNSLGRLWMLNHPDSRLIDRAKAEDPADRLMEYYIAPDTEHEDFIRVASPEEITFCDPACGSGHILVYAFNMLMAIYEECGYRTRDIPELILTKNLSGMEIDPRAAQIAALALTMCAREHDRRFFDRSVSADIRMLHDVEIDMDSLAPTSALFERPALLEELAHLGEIGSLLAPTDDDIAALEGELARPVAGNLFSENASEGVETALGFCKALRRRFDVVVANPPYMGGSSFNPFMSKWMKKHYPDSCKDLCTAFIERGYTLAHDNGYAAMVAMQSWMFLGSFEKMRKHIINEKTIVAMAHLGTRAFDAIGGEVVSVTADVLYNSKTAAKGAYFRLVDIAGGEPKRQKLLEAIQNPDCGYFYRADATTFHDIPGSPIAYWASENVMRIFRKTRPLKTFAPTKKGMFTGNNDYFLKQWFEISHHKLGNDFKPYCKGGPFRRWYGNYDYVIRWHSNGKEILESTQAGNINVSDYFRPCIFWSLITSGDISFRIIATDDFVMGDAGPACYPKYDEMPFLLGLLNSSSIRLLSKMINPTLNWSCGVVGSFPTPSLIHSDRITEPVAQCIHIAQSDWNCRETSWNFKRNPMV